jgi:PAS domain S-box-containing protein
MNDMRKTKAELIEELEQLRLRVVQLEQVKDSSDTMAKLYNLAVNEAPVSIWACDRNWKIVYWNPGAERMYKSRREDVIGKSFLDLFVTDEEREQAMIDIERVFNGETIHNYIVEDVLPDGTRITIQNTSYPIFDESGSVYLHAEIAFDISNTILSRVHKVAVEAPAVSIWACDENWRIQFWNSGAERIYQARREEVIGRSFLELFVSEKDKENAIRDLQRVFRGEPIEESYIAEDKLLDDTTRFLLTNVYPVYDDEGRVILQAEIGQDITQEEIRRGTIHDIGRQLTSASELVESEVLEAVFEQASRLMDTSDMYIALYDDEKEQVSFGLAMDNGRRVDVLKEEGWEPRQAGEGMTEWVIETKEAQRPPNPEEEYRKFKNYVPPAPKSWMGIPLIARGRVIGVIVVMSFDKTGAYEQYHQDALQAVADYAAIAIQNARLYQQLTRNIGELEMLRGLGDSLSSWQNL